MATKHPTTIATNTIAAKIPSLFIISNIGFYKAAQGSFLFCFTLIPVSQGLTRALLVINHLPNISSNLRSKTFKILILTAGSMEKLLIE